jgi:hypothetical protein
MNTSLQLAQYVKKYKQFNSYSTTLSVITSKAAQTDSSMHAQYLAMVTHVKFYNGSHAPSYSVHMLLGHIMVDVANSL